MTRLTRLLFGTSLLATSLLHEPAARADMLQGLGRWSGSGSILSPEGQPLGSFRVELTRSATGPDQVETRGTVTTEQGQVAPFRSTLTRTRKGLLVESGRGQGHATCVDPGVCHSYEIDANGDGATTTILVEGDGRLRILVTELEGGKPARLLWQTLSRP